MSLSHTEYPIAKPDKWWQSDILKWIVIAAMCLFTGYLTIVMYAQGEYLFAMLTLVLLGSGLYILPTVKPMRGATSIPVWQEWGYSFCFL